MKLAAWRRREGLTQQELAARLGVSQPYVSLMERATNPRIPDHPLMAKIYLLSRGDVQPNDFYELPRLPRIEAAQRRRAA